MKYKRWAEFVEDRHHGAYLSRSAVGHCLLSHEDLTLGDVFNMMDRVIFYLKKQRDRYRKVYVR